MQPDFTARRGLRAFVLILVTSLFFLSSGSAYAASSVSPTVAAGRGAKWMSDQIIANGGFLKSFGSPDVTNTAYAVIGLHAVKIGQTASDEALAYLQTQLGAPLQSGGSDAPGALSYDILAAVAAGQDPAHFGGTGPANDLVSRLIATQRTTGPDAGLFGVQDPGFDGTFRQGLALTALKAAKQKLTTSLTVISGIAWLTHQQCSNGLFEAYRSDTSVPCDAADALAFTGPDTNSSSFAIQGLATWGFRPLQAQAIASFHAAQSADGGFPYIAAGGQTSDPNSTALVIQGLVAEKEHPSQTATWGKPAGSPLTALESYQIGCSGPTSDRGGFFYPDGDPTPNTLATVQAVPALVLKAFPVAKSTTLKATPAPVTCPV